MAAVAANRCEGKDAIIGRRRRPRHLPSALLRIDVLMRHGSNDGGRMIVIVLD